MATSTIAGRPRAFEPRMKADSEPPSAPGWDVGPERRIGDGQTLAAALAWFSIGLGAVELLASERLCDYLGMRDRTRLVRAMGGREIVSGIGIRSRRRPTGWIAGRIAGDAIDLALLATALGRRRHRRRVAVAIGAVLGATALDVICFRQLSRTRG